MWNSDWLLLAQQRLLTNSITIQIYQNLLRKAISFSLYRVCLKCRSNVFVKELIVKRERNIARERLKHVTSHMIIFIIISISYTWSWAIYPARNGYHHAINKGKGWSGYGWTSSEHTDCVDATKKTYLAYLGIVASELNRPSGKKIEKQ
jgi:hypothetical protein